MKGIYLYGTCLVTLMTALYAASSAAENLVELLTFDQQTWNRLVGFPDRRLANTVSDAALLLVSGGLYFAHWRKVKGHQRRTATEESRPVSA